MGVRNWWRRRTQKRAPEPMQMPTVLGIKNGRLQLVLPSNLGARADLQSTVIPNYFPMYGENYNPVPRAKAAPAYKPNYTRRNNRATRVRKMLGTETRRRTRSFGNRFRNLRNRFSRIRRRTQSAPPTVYFNVEPNLPNQQGPPATRLPYNIRTRAAAFAEPSAAFTRTPRYNNSKAYAAYVYNTRPNINAFTNENLGIKPMQFAKGRGGLPMLPPVTTRPQWLPPRDLYYGGGTK